MNATVVVVVVVDSSSNHINWVEEIEQENLSVFLESFLIVIFDKDALT